jgi:hypothetical protein
MPRVPKSTQCESESCLEPFSFTPAPTFPYYNQGVTLVFGNKVIIQVLYSPLFTVGQFLLYTTHFDNILTNSTPTFGSLNT